MLPFVVELKWLIKMVKYCAWYAYTQYENTYRPTHREKNVLPQEEEGRILFSFENILPMIVIDHFQLHQVGNSFASWTISFTILSTL